MNKIRWGILGPGHIAHKFAQDLKLAEDADLVAVASRSLNRAKAFAEEYDISFAFGDYETLIKSDTVDVLYIATPHVAHKELSIAAMNHGKHVLCEKPLGINLAEVQELVETARINNVFLMEALWSRFNPAIIKAKELAAKGTLGKLRYINADFAFYAIDRPKESRLLNPSLAGGTLLDIGIYPVFLAYLFLGIPEKIKAISNFNNEGTEIQTSVIFCYPQAQAILNSSFTHNARMSAEISGTVANLTLNPRFHQSDGLTLSYMGHLETLDLPYIGNGYYHEIIEVNKCINKGVLESQLWSHADSCALISLLDQIRKITGVTFPFEQ